MCLPSGKEPALPGPPSEHLSRAEEALGGPAVPQAWGLFLAMSYYAIRVPIFSVALLDGEVGGALGTRPPRPTFCSGVSRAPGSKPLGQDCLSSLV